MPTAVSFPFSSITTTNSQPSGSDGLFVPTWSTRATLGFYLASGTGTTLTFELWGKWRLTGEWKPIPLAETANLVNESDDQVMWEINTALYERLAPYVTTFSGTSPVVDGIVTFSEY